MLLLVCVLKSLFLKLNNSLSCFCRSGRLRELRILFAFKKERSTFEHSEETSDLNSTSLIDKVGCFTLAITFTVSVFGTKAAHIM